MKKIAAVQARLIERGKIVSVAIATRSALRVLPLTCPSYTKKVGPPPGWENLALNIFRTNIVCWSYNIIPAEHEVLRALAVDARDQLMATTSSVTHGMSDTAAYAASDAAICVAADENERKIPAIHASQTVISGSFGSNIRTTALGADLNMLEAGLSISEVVSNPLWHGSQSPGLVSSWRQLESNLLKTNHNWNFWTKWYLDRIYGRPVTPSQARAWTRLINPSFTSYFRTL